ncbi:MAG: SLBB domain-containing protein [Candidatus Eiseniibacteriota bacterium]|nr:MAG: SLBB domain-containing protein [Candidatus Eisenbacteria bacterium]
MLLPVGSPASSGPGTCEAAQAGEYVIGLEDVLAVTVRERPDLSGTFLVGPQGTIALPLLGEVKAAGMTPSQLSRELSRRLSVFRAGEAVVTVAQYNSRKIFVVGEVVKPGKYTFPAIPSVWHVLSEAGGPTDAALLGAVQIIRAGTGETVTVDVRKLISGESAEQVKLFPGDTIRVPRRSVTAPEGQVIYVLGEVQKPGSYEVAFAKDVVAAVSAAGGPTERADLRKITIVRRTVSASTTMEVNLDKYLRQGLLSANPDLRSGDTITVPRRRSAFGALTSPAVLTALLSAIASIVVITSSK